MIGRRNIFLWYVISIVTLGIMGIVWYYKLNKDAKTLANNDSWSPGLSVVAITVGALIIVPPYVSIWRTWSRVREATHADGLSAGLQFCLCYIPLVNIAYSGYLQSKLNASASEPTPGLAGEATPPAVPASAPAPTEPTVAEPAPADSPGEPTPPNGREPETTDTTT